MRAPAPWRGAGGGAGNQEIGRRLNSTPYRRPQDSSRLCEPLRRLQWLRQEFDLWNEAEGNRPMPQPRTYGLRLRDMRPSEVLLRRAA